ncbi:hypothetical protein Dsin_009250 [Dipteronia sinensis]|uniref:Endonuclease/exonuclease/phosphatase domain-containing protein n=1 Tax=Dipteronia sinensis TaxID=43782 RepID=A0AAE0AR91_9ROSI|nr:hypothetical protein Dsin_009250 [Dipteronia sinensis]
MGPNAGKWKMWVRDGVRLSIGPNEDNKLGKRPMTEENEFVTKKLRLGLNSEESFNISVDQSAGDFNEILEDSEKVGGPQKLRSLLEGFRYALDDCNLQDLGFSGPAFTWCNKRGSFDMVQKRLYRCVWNLQWKNLFPGSSVKRLEFWKSDHIPLLSSISQSICSSTSNILQGNRMFHFEDCWASEKGCADIVEET